MTIYHVIARLRVRKDKLDALMGKTSDDGWDTRTVILDDGTHVTVEFTGDIELSYRQCMQYERILTGAGFTGIDIRVKK